MLGILLIYLVGRKFYDLAGNHNKHQWGYAILGVFSYYVGTFIAGIVIALYLEFFGSTSIDEINEFVLSLIAIPFGLLACWVTYLLLEKNWEKKTVHDNTDILDIDFIEEEKN